MAAAATAEACGADNSPARAAAATAGRLPRRRAVSRTSPAWPTDVPVVRARLCAAERSPACFQAPAAAQRAAASPLMVAAIFSMAAASPTASAACSADSTEGSNLAA